MSESYAYLFNKPDSWYKLNIGLILNMSYELTTVTYAFELNYIPIRNFNLQSARKPIVERCRMPGLSLKK